MPNLTLVQGNTRVVYVAKQSAKGTAASTPVRKLRLTGNSLDPGRSIITLPETDSSSQAAQAEVVGAAPGGQFETWLRPNDCDLLLYGLMGATPSDSGSGNYTHTLNPATATPYLTIWDVVPGYSTTKYVDCRVTQGTFSGQSGQGIQASWTVAGLTALVNQTEPTLPAAFSTDPAMTYPQVTVTRGGTHNGDVDAFSVTVNRNGQYFVGDNGLTAADYVNGLFEVSGSMTIAFQNAQEYSSFNTGATNGTALTTTIYNQALDLIIAIDSNTSVDFVSSGIEYRAFPIGMDTGGAPVTVAAAFATKPQATWSNNLSVVVKNQQATVIA